MKILNKLILPFLVLIILAILYFSYFAPSDELGKFSKYDSNSNASMPIIVKLVKDRGISRNADGGYSFYVVDGDNKVMAVNGPESLPPGMDDAKSMVLMGHLSGETFHAHGVELRN